MSRTNKENNKFICNNQANFLKNNPFLIIWSMHTSKYSYNIRKQSPVPLREKSRKLILKYSIYNQFFKSENKVNRMLGFVATNTPHYYYYFLPTSFYIPPTVTPDFEPKTELVETDPKYSLNPPKSPQIILTRQDLLQEGYDQSKRPWSKEEDRLLLRLCRNEQARFQEIAKQIQGRNAKMCYSRFRRLSYQTKIIWTEEENQRLVQLVNQYGQEHWKHFQNQFKGRTLKQIRDHYENNLKPDVNRNEWNLEEDLLLIDLVNKYGRNWKEIEDRLRGRSRNQIKNRFFGKICRLNSKKKIQMENTIQPQHGNITNFSA